MAAKKHGGGSAAIGVRGHHGDVQRFADYRRARAVRALTRMAVISIAVVSIACGALFGLGRLAGWGPFAPGQTIAQASYSPDRWNLIVVNRWHRVPDAWPAPRLTQLSNGEQVDSRVYPYLQRMFDDMRAAGLRPVVSSGYRSHDRQQQLFDEKRFLYKNEGMDAMAARAAAEKWVALPGTSEHELGLAVDINALGAQSIKDSAGEHQWLARNAWRYGFILRYPQGGSAVTGTDYEPWHYRYVGLSAARDIQESGQTLEEYVRHAVS